MRAGGAGADLTGGGATTCEDLGGGGGAFHLGGDFTAIRMGTVGIGLGLTDDCDCGPGGAAGGVSRRIGGGGRRGGGAELPISFLPEGTGRAGGFGTLRGRGVGARDSSAFGTDGGLPSVPSLLGPAGFSLGIPPANKPPSSPPLGKGAFGIGPAPFDLPKSLGPDST